MKCLRKFKWVKLPRQEMPRLKGRLSHWLKLAESAAFRKGIGTYCGHKNPVEPVIQYGKYGSMLTLETLGKRWGWEKTKVWRFFRKYPTYFHLYRLPNSYGCVIYSRFYPTCDEIQMPEEESVMSIFRKILICAQNTHTEGTVNEKALCPNGNPISELCHFRWTEQARRGKPFNTGGVEKKSSNKTS